MWLNSPPTMEPVRLPPLGQSRLWRATPVVAAVQVARLQQ
jgi:hypothetical protein